MLCIALGIILAQAPKAQKPIVAPAQLPQAYILKTPAPTKTLATVNGEPIIASDVEAFLWDWRGTEALQDVVSFRLIEQAAKRAQVTITPEETDAAVQKQLDQIKKNLPPGQTVDESLRNQGYPKSRLYLRVRSELLLDKIVLKDFKPAEFVKVATIIIRPASEQTPALSAAIKKADDAFAELQKGTPWDTVLAEYEKDQRTLAAHGLLGWKRVAAFPQSIAAEMVKVKPGGYTEPAQTPNGIQIFRVDAHGPSATTSELNEMKNTFLSANGPAILNKIRGDAKIVKFYP